MIDDNLDENDNHNHDKNNKDDNDDSNYNWNTNLHTTFGCVPKRHKVTDHKCHKVRAHLNTFHELSFNNIVAHWCL